MKKHVSKFMLLFLSFVLIFPSFTNAEGNKHAERQIQPQNQKAAQFKAEMRKLWMEHNFWTEKFVVSSIAGLGDQEPVLARLLKNQADLGNAIKPFYGEAAGNELGQLLREHIQIGGQVVSAAKSGNQADFKKYNAAWFKNADDITNFLTKANPNYNKKELNGMLYMHLKLITDGVVAKLNKDWRANIEALDKNEEHLLHMSDAIADGIIKQFPNKF
ncbi:glycosyltransferase [Neobacillus sp. CF12]|uniref:glycosyltransferase n=1 Tax=Neobacillus sp. CF12 TaxID=3055864 RepID=UPI0025A1E7A9|nr:glycosyltransferase [Neobacillus sp. CF12]MDM5328908.1 glycosyltransferase [Neobacillus sp. CF12]